MSHRHYIIKDKTLTKNESSKILKLCPIRNVKLLFRDSVHQLTKYSFLFKFYTVA